MAETPWGWPKLANAKLPSGLAEETYRKGYEKAYGKAIKRIRVAQQVPEDGAHTAEAMIVEFDDGSEMAIVPGSNAGNFSPEHGAEEFRIDLNVMFKES